MVTVQKRSRTRRQRLLAAALSIFAEQGYNATAIDDVARASETSKGGLYFHFPSKQALFLSLLDEASQALLDNVHEAIAIEPDPLRRGEIALQEVLRTFGEHRLVARLLLIEANGAGREFTAKHHEMHQAFTSLIASCLDDAVDQGLLPPLDSVIVANAWYGAVNQIVLRWLVTGQPERLESAFPPLRSLLLHGVFGQASAATS
jgi:AcrR family transcriptional regulator